MAEDIVLRGRDASGAAFASVLRNFDSLQRSAISLRSVFRTLLTAVSIREIGAVFEGFSKGADQIGKVAQKAGQTTTNLQELVYAARLADTDIETLQKGIKILSTNLFDVQASSGASASAFKILGIDTKTTSGELKSSKEVLYEIADAFSAMDDGVAKSALAVKYFGRAGVDMIPVLNQGSTALFLQAQRAHELGRVLSAETIQSATEFNDRMKDFREAIYGVRDAIGSGLIPALNDMAGQFRTSSIQGEAWKELGKDIGTGLRELAVYALQVGRAFQVSGTFIGAWFAARSTDWKGVFGEKGRAVLKDALNDIDSINKQWDARIERMKMDLADLGDMGLGGYPPFKAPPPYVPDEAAQKKADADFTAALKQASDERQRINIGYEDERVKLDKDANELLKLQLHQMVDESQRIEMSGMADLKAQQEARSRAFSEEQSAQQKALTDTTDYAREMGQVFTSSFLAIIQKGGSAREILQGLLGDIAAIVAKATIEKPVMNLIGAALSSIGGAFSGGATVYPSQWGSDFTVPGVSGTDSQFVPILASPGERIRVTPQSKSGSDGGGNSFYVDMRGASVDAVARLEKLVVSLNASIEHRAVNAVSDARTRGKLR